MVINGKRLLEAPPIEGMLDHKARSEGVSHGLAEVGYDIRIKQRVRFFSAFGAERVEVICPERGKTKIEKGRFTIASAKEKFRMPGNLVGIVHDKSTWARLGLSVFNTVIEPGWEGYLTLELVYHGNTELVIPAGAGIAQVIFSEIAEPAKYTGKYQGQEDMPVAARRG